MAVSAPEEAAIGDLVRIAYISLNPLIIEFFTLCGLLSSEQIGLLQGGFKRGTKSVIDPKFALRPTILSGAYGMYGKGPRVT